MSNAFRGGWLFKVGDGGSPTETFNTVGEVSGLSGLGKTNDQIKVTNADSGNDHEYIAGMADGQEITVECNYLPANAYQAALKTAVNNGANVNVQFYITDGTTVKTFSFAVTGISWVLNPAVEDKNTISFTLKISGAITEA